MNVKVSQEFLNVKVTQEFPHPPTAAGHREAIYSRHHARSRVNKLWKGLFWGLVIEAAAVTVLWVATLAAGTSYAALVALGVLPILLIVFPEKRR